MLPYPLQWIKSAQSLLSHLKKYQAKYHKSCFSKYNAQKLSRNKEDFETSSQSLANSRGKRKRTSDITVVCVFCGQKEKDLSKMSKKEKVTHRLHAAGELYTTVSNPNKSTLKI